METTPLSATAQAQLTTYADYLTTACDLSSASIRNYLGDVKLFMAWYEQVLGRCDNLPQMCLSKFIVILVGLPLYFSGIASV
jgi:site-specific recombinase XerD